MTGILQIGADRQLFIDDYCLGELRGTRRRFHQVKKHPANPIMTARDGELEIQVYGNVLYDPGMSLYRIWYNARFATATNQGFAVCHATSRDGLNWDRTPLNRAHRALSNAVLQGYVRGPTVFFTPDDPDPARRFRMFLHTGRDLVGHADLKAPFTAGYSMLFSPDGFEWAVRSGREVNPCPQ